MAQYRFTSEGLLGKMVKDAKELELFTRFCVKEFSPENLFCGLASGQYQAEPTLGRAEAIWKVFLNGQESVLEVNVPRNLGVKVYERINATMLANMSRTSIKAYVKSPDDLFTEVERNMVTNLSDTYSRYQFNFKKTKSWELTWNNNTNLEVKTKDINWRDALKTGAGVKNILGLHSPLQWAKSYSNEGVAKDSAANVKMSCPHELREGLGALTTAGFDFREIRERVFQG
jgi:hypothetical protein